MGRPWVKLPTDYQGQLDLALAAATPAQRTAAELLFLRAWAWCGAVESGGFVPATTLALLSARASAAALLVEAGMWERMPTGWNVLGWEELQTSADEIALRRAADAERKRKWRAAKASGSRDESRDGHAAGSRDVRSLDVDGDVEAACGGSGTPPPPGDFVPENALPPELVILRRALEAHRLDVGFNKLSPARVQTIVELVRLHGDAELVRIAKQKWRPEQPAAYVQAWLTDWEAMPAPGERLRVVIEKCPEHLLEQPCGGCAADLKAANRGTS